jgi:hypothetical protein
MSLEKQLRSLARLPKPAIGPFWAARVTADATATTPRSVPVSRGEAIYWIALAVIAGPLLLTSWQRVACLVLVLVSVRAVAGLTVLTSRSAVRRPHTTP